MPRMKRLTRAVEDYHVVKPIHIHRDRFEDFTGPAVEKLAEYEATGLTPTEVQAKLEELTYIRTEREALYHDLKKQENEISALKSEREYFRSRAEFFREVAGRNKSAI